ncbi:MAG: hypothetical protein J7M34_04265 [Anaerolineae bacterium]|nr:hypothetical protein [Anaerolineae bacterium]
MDTNVKQEQRLGVIDALSAGFDLVSHHAWLILPVVALDLALWLGPRLSIRPLVVRLLDMWQAALSADASTGASVTKLVAGMLGDTDRELNLLLLLANRMVGQPSLAALLPGGGLGGVVEITNALVAIGCFVVLAALGLLIAAFYLSLIAGRVREGDNGISFGRGLVRRWVQLLIYLAALFIITVAVSVPFSIVIAVAMLLGPAIGPALISLTSVILIWIGLWIFLSLFFVPEAIVLDDAHVAAAVWRSVNVVGRNFWGTVGLWVLTEIIMVGFSLIWQRLSQWPAGALASIVGNAYLGTGLVAASFIFYQDRYRRWQTQRGHRII